MTITLRYSGGAANADPALSLGGAMSSVEVPSLARLYPVVTPALRASGIVWYSCVYVRADAPVTAVRAWISSETPSLQTTIGIGWGVVNETAPTIASNTTAPGGVTFATASTYVSAGDGADLIVPWDDEELWADEGLWDEAAHRALWIRYTVSVNAALVSLDMFTIAVEGSPSVPVNTGAPSISGTLVVGQTITLNVGTWTGEPSSYSRLLESSVDGSTGWTTVSTGTSYLLTSTETGKRLRLSAVATNDGGDGARAYSTVSAAVLPLAPVNTAVPVVTGSTAMGQTLTTTNGTWSGSPTSYERIWIEFFNGGLTTISGQTATTFTTTAAQVGKSILTGVRATNAGGTSAYAYSLSTDPITATAYVADPNHFGMKQGWANTGGHTSGPGGTYDTLYVTNLNASGAGSLRAAVEASGARLVVFEVSGNIDLAGANLDISNPFITVAGQTAPSPGITIIKGQVRPMSNNFILSHLKIRAGTGAGSTKDSLETRPGARNGIITHCSFSWGTDGTLDIGGFNLTGTDPAVWRDITSRHITIDRCIIAETLTVGSGACLNEDNSNYILWYGNFFSNNYTRLPIWKGGSRGALINNLGYNGQDKFVDATLVAGAWSGKTYQEVWLDATGNYYKAGPGTSSVAAFFESVSNHGTRYYGSDNTALRTNGTSYPQTLAVANTQSYNMGNYITIVGSPNLTGHGITPIAASAVPAMVAASSGAFPWDRDEIDARQFTRFSAGTWGGSYPSTQTYPTSVNNSKTFVPAHWNLATMEPTNALALSSTMGTVTDVDSSSNTVVESATNGTAVGITARATHPGYTISYTLSDSASGKFSIHSTTGVVSKAAALSYASATSHNITVLATSSDGVSTASETFTINVTEVASRDAVLVGNVRGGTGTVTTSSGTTTTGSTFLICIAKQNSTVHGTPTDSFGNSYSILNSQVGTVDPRSVVYYKQNGTGGASHTASVPWTGSASGATVHFIEVKGVATSSLDVSPAGTIDSSSPFTAASGTLAQANEVIVSFCASDSGSNPATYASSNTTVISQLNNGATDWTSAVSKLVVSSTASVSPSWTCTGAGTANVHVMSFKGA